MHPFEFIRFVPFITRVRSVRAVFQDKPIAIDRYSPNFGLPGLQLILRDFYDLVICNEIRLTMVVP
jgi:hypothetical protein